MSKSKTWNHVGARRRFHAIRNASQTFYLHRTIKQNLICDMRPLLSISAFICRYLCERRTTRPVSAALDSGERRGSLRRYIFHALITSNDTKLKKVVLNVLVYIATSYDLILVRTL